METQVNASVPEKEDTKSEKTLSKVTALPLSKPLLKLKLLEVLRDGSFQDLESCIQKRFVPLESPVVKAIAPYILHYAVQVAPLRMIKDLVKYWVDNPIESMKSLGIRLELNGQDQDGNSPLHLAASQSRKNVIEFLLDQPNINECLLNNEGLLPIDMCKNLNVAEMMQLKRSNYIATIVQLTDEAFDNKDFKFLEKVYSNPRNSDFMDINRLEPEHNGNTLLHRYVLKKDVDVCHWLLQHGANPLLKNTKGATPLDLVHKGKPSPSSPPSQSSSEGNISENKDLKKIFNDMLQEEGVARAAKALEKAPTYKGYLKKYTRVGKGYKLRYFVLDSKGKLSYYKNSQETSKPPKGSLILAACTLQMNSTEKLKFEVIGGSNRSAKWKLKGNLPVETNNWVMVIQRAIKYAKDKEAAKKQNDKSKTKTRVRSPSSSSTKPLNNLSVPSSSHRVARASTFDAQISRANVNTTRIPPALSIHRKPSDSSSIVSDEVDLSNKFTDSGKKYVSKLADSRHRSSSLTKNTSPEESVPRPLSPLANPSFMVSSSGISYMHTSTRSLASPTSPIGVTYQEGIGEGNSEDDDSYGNDALNHDKDEENLNVEYGPFVESLNVYQKTIALELSSVNELLESQDALKSEDTLNTLKISLRRLSVYISEMNTLTLQRDERLVSMLSKQRDMNNVWIQTMKDLEIELQNKSERLATLGRGRKTLKRTLRKKMLEAGTESNLNSTENMKSINSEVSNVGESNDTLDQIAQFITATKAEDEISSDDEFYDAEELMDEIEMQKMADNNESDSLSFAKTDEEDLQLSGANEANADFDEPIIITASHIRSSGAKFDIESENENENENEKENEKENEPNTVDDLLDDETSMRKIDLVKQSSKDIGNKTEIEKLLPSATLDNKSQSKSEEQENNKGILPKKVVGITKAQKEKELLLWREGSYLGYGDGIRKKLALSQDDRPKVSLWAVLKSMIGKDMTRMTLPVVFNEPTSLLQRVAEDIECSELLDQAASFKDSSLRLLYVAIFTASCYASTTGRIAKPFNPLLGETYEYTREDKNYRFFSEQVSHHPPVSATWTESPKWDFWGESAVDTNFNGRSFGVKHLGLWYIKIRPDSNEPEELYTYKKPDNTVVGILVGNPQVDNHGEVKIVNHMTGDYCILNFKARGWRSSSAYEIKGEVFDKHRKKLWVLGGHWNDSIYGKRVTNSNKGEEINLHHHHNKNKSNVRSNSNSGNTSEKDPGPNYDGNKFLIWKANSRPSAPFNLTRFAITLNAPQPHLVPWLAPTDTRLRPDQRAMEDGEYDKAAEEKNRVEEKQRAVRRYREERHIKYEPRWFRRETHPITKLPYWHYTGEYWRLRRDKKLANEGDIF